MPPSVVDLDAGLTGSTICICPAFFNSPVTCAVIPAATQKFSGFHFTTLHQIQELHSSAKEAQIDFGFYITTRKLDKGGFAWHLDGLVT